MATPRRRNPLRNRPGSSLSGPVLDEKSPIVVLQDQGGPIRISLSHFGLHTGKQPSWDDWGMAFQGANAQTLQALEVQTDFVPAKGEIALKLTPGGTVGAVPLFAPDTRKTSGGLVIKPRFGWSGIGRILHRIGWGATPDLLPFPLVPGSAREVPPWVIAGPVLRRLEALLNEFRKGFRVCEMVPAFPRGQILWGRYINEEVIRGSFHRLPCRFPDLGPDLLIQSYARWGLEKVRASLLGEAVADSLARTLLELAEQLLTSVREVPSKEPSAGFLDRLSRIGFAHSEAFLSGLESLRWLQEDRGLAETAKSDGLAWRIPMPDLFEQWVGQILKTWSRNFGGIVLSGKEGRTRMPLSWRPGSSRALSSLVPDFLVRAGDKAYVVDAKYKAHFEKMEFGDWNEFTEETMETHRQDVHQVLAYAAAQEAKEISAILAYPVRKSAWDRLLESGRVIHSAPMTTFGRNLTLNLAAVPLELGDEADLRNVCRADNVRYFSHIWV